MANFSSKIGGVHVIPQYTAGLIEAEPGMVQNMLDAMNKADIKYRIVSDHVDCISKGCFRRTGLGTALADKEAITTVSFKNWTSLDRFHKLMEKMRKEELAKLGH